MVNPFHEVNWAPGRPERRKFAVSLMIGFPAVAVGLLLAARLHGGSWRIELPLAVGGIGLAAGLVFWALPQLVRPFYVGWYAVACSIGFVVGNVALAAVYLFLFVPIGLVRRVLGRQTFSKGFDRGAPTYWRDARKTVDLTKYYRQF